MFYVALLPQETAEECRNVLQCLHEPKDDASNIWVRVEFMLVEQSVV